MAVTNDVQMHSIPAEPITAGNIADLARTYPAPEIPGMSLALTDAAEIRTIDDDTTFELAEDCANRLKGCITSVEKHYDGAVKAAHALHKALCDRRREDSVVAANEMMRLDRLTIAYRGEKERKAREETARLERERLERERLEREERERRDREALERAAALDAQGKADEAAAVIEERTAEAEEERAAAEVVAPQVIIPPSIPKVSGVSVRKTYKVRCDSLRELVKAAAKDDAGWMAYGHLLAFNESAANAQAKACKGGIQFPGCTVTTDSASARRGV